MITILIIIIISALCVAAFTIYRKWVKKYDFLNDDIEVEAIPFNGTKVDIEYMLLKTETEKDSGWESLLEERDDEENHPYNGNLGLDKEYQCVDDLNLNKKY